MTAGDKDQIRRRAWSAIREAGAARFPGVEGRIPNFTGSERAAERLAGLAAWDAARVVKVNPDSPQTAVRKRALEDGKILYMAVPRLAEPAPFWMLDPDRLEMPIHRACTIKGAGDAGTPVTLAEMQPIDLIVCGSVAVERGGARLGKGGGYSDIEFAITVEAGLTTDDTTVVSTVHPCQIFEDGAIPVLEHDFPLDLIVTEDEAITTETDIARPPGIVDVHLTDEKRSSIPVLADR